MMLAKLTLRQEDMINQMALDRSFLLFLQAGRDSILPDMILAAKEWHHQRQNTWCHLLPSTGQFSQSGPESDSENDEVEVRQPGRSLGPSPSTERDSDSRERLELPLLGQCGKMPSTNQESTATAGEDSRAYNTALTAGQSGRSDPTLLSSQAHEPRSDPGRFTGDDTLAPRPQPPERSFDPVVRAAQHLERKRDLPADPTAPEANWPAKIPACYRNRPPCETLMRQLLRTKLYNSSNSCYINTALLEQLWATLAHESFDPVLWGLGSMTMHPLTSRMQQNFGLAPRTTPP